MSDPYRVILLVLSKARGNLEVTKVAIKEKCNRFRNKNNKTKNEVLATTRTPDLSHLTIFAYGQKQTCQALKDSATRTATINKEAEGDCVCMCTHVHACTRSCSNNRVVLYLGILRQNPLMTVLYSVA